jgi:hypothetical protein
MKTYSINSPSINGVLSDDYLYFEGTPRPSQIFTIQEGQIYTPEDIIVLEKYFNDTYNLFLRKLTIFSGNNEINDEETVKLQALLQELIKVKKLIENTSKTAIMTK